MEPPTVIIDNGTGYTKMGYSGNLEPSYIIPSAISMRINNKDNNPLKIKDLEFHIGDGAHKYRTDPKNYEFNRLLRAGQIESWEGIEKFWHKSIN